MTIEEMRNKLNEMETEVRGLLEGDKVEEAKAKMEEVRAMKSKIQIQEELEAEEKRDLEKQKETEKRGNEDMAKLDEMRCIVKYAIGKEQLTDEERKMVKTTDNSAVMPKQFVSDLQIIQKGYGSLKDLCDIIQVNKNEGTIPVVNLDQNEMLDVAEGADIVDGTLCTTDVQFKCSKVGLKQTITNETIDDAVISIENLARKNFANIATVKENKKILDVITKNATAVEGAKDYTDIENVIDGSLPSVKAGLVTITNVTGYCYLKNMKDKNGRNLDLITTVGDKEYFKGKEIRYVEDAMLPTSAKEKKCVFYVGNLKEAVKYIDRKQITIKKWEDNDNDTSKMSILERLDVICGSKRSLKKIEF
ncbi:phage major capsid protein [Clostridium botulinum C]|uniref:phage major capsid protein n=1 Tax=Clostridium botulinum TaxID=1491 RepID=UPI001E3A0698|nr:phage major capsid protein [Clostridium botulinum]MCD3217878.1 phage major capsid protein [Clostridium botulinum C]